jgi:hypothetical protein
MSAGGEALLVTLTAGATSRTVTVACAVLDAVDASSSWTLAVTVSV